MELNAGFSIGRGIPAGLGARGSRGGRLSNDFSFSFVAGESSAFEESFLLSYPHYTRNMGEFISREAGQCRKGVGTCARCSRPGADQPGFEKGKLVISEMVLLRTDSDVEPGLVFSADNDFLS